MWSDNAGAAEFMPGTSNNLADALPYIPLFNKNAKHDAL